MNTQLENENALGHGRKIKVITVRAARGNSQIPTFDPPLVEVYEGDTLRFVTEGEPLTFCVYDRFSNHSACLFGGNAAMYSACKRGTDLEVRGRRGSQFVLCMTGQEKPPAELFERMAVQSPGAENMVMAAGGRDYGQIKVGP
jgi:hypothetical protein